jgi:hypothetical protein
MSELIDSIFDVSKISKEVSDITADLDGLKKIISTYSADVKKLYDDARGSKTQDELVKNTKAVNDAMVTGSKAVKDYQTELEKLKAKTDQLTGAEKAANIEIAKARLELAAAQKEVKATAIAEIEAAAATGKLGDSYNELQNDLKKSMVAYKELTAAERDSASGKELLKKISSTQDELKDLDAGMKVYNRNVGNYASALEGITPQVGGLAGKLFEIAKAAKASSEELNKGANATNDGITRLGSAPGLFSKIGLGLKGIGQIIGTVGKAFLANPIGLVLAGIALVVKGVTNAFARNEEKTNQLKSSFAGLTPVLKIMREGFDRIADGIIKIVGFSTKALTAVTNFLRITSKESVDSAKELADNEARLRDENRKSQLVILEYQKAEEKLRQTRDDTTLSIEERIDANKKLGETLKQQLSEELKIAQLGLKVAEERIKQDGASTENLDKRAEALTKIADIEERITGQASEQLVNENSLRKEATDLAIAAAKERADAEKEAAKNILEAQRRLNDSKLSLMAEGEEKQIAMNAESFRREIEDLEAAGQLTAELRQNLEAANAIEIQKIRDDFAKQRADKDQADFEKQLAAFEKNLQREVDLLNDGYQEKEIQLKKQFASGLISREKYEADLANLQAEAAKEANEKTIQLLKKELELANISQDKKIEISDKIRDLQIQNENAVLDATIEANDKKVEADKIAADKRKAIAKEILNAGIELFGAVGDFQKQQSDNRLTEIEAEQKANEEYFQSRQENLDNSIMSEANRELAQKRIDEERAKREKEIADKQRAEKIRQAKWEKAQSLISAIVGSATATVGALGAQPWSVANFVFAALTAAAGAAQIATIVSQKIPAYEKGGVTKNEVALWGEKRPEVAVTRTGEVMFAERPTVTKFDAGTRIYKSVEDYEKNMNMTGSGKGFEFDYDRMAEAMPATTINLDSSGLWGIVNRQNDRAIMINRRYKIGR